jgi:hypothetical protein
MLVESQVTAVSSGNPFGEPARVGSRAGYACSEGALIMGAKAGLQATTVPNGKSFGEPARVGSRAECALSERAPILERTVPFG